MHLSLLSADVGVKKKSCPVVEKRAKKVVVAHSIYLFCGLERDSEEFTRRVKAELRYGELLSQPLALHGTAASQTLRSRSNHGVSAVDGL
jgi:hypothetical protein